VDPHLVRVRAWVPARHSRGPTLPGSAMSRSVTVAEVGHYDVYVIKLKIYKYNNYNTPPKSLFYTLGPA